MAALPAISAIMGLAGTAVTAMGTIAAGKAAQQSANYEAAQLDMKAKEEQAASQREAQEYGRRRDLALSELTNKAAASGFSATDPTSLALADEIARYGTFQEQMAMYGGQSRREGLQNEATGKRFEGAAKRMGANYSAAGTILGGVSSFADRFGKPFNETAATSSYRYG